MATDLPPSEKAPTPQTDAHSAPSSAAPAPDVAQTSTATTPSGEECGKQVPRAKEAPGDPEASAQTAETADSSSAAVKLWRRLRQTGSDFLLLALGLLGTVGLYLLFALLFCVIWNFKDFWALNWRTWVTGDFRELWLPMVALVPAFLIYQHGLWCRTQELKFKAVSSDNKANRRGYDPRVIVETANKESERQYSLPTIAVDYFLPALLAAGAAGVVGFALSYIRNNRGSLGDVPEEQIYAGIVFGAIGAYMYVVINLGQRAFVRDITPGVAVWSAVHLFLGPILGGLVAAIWQPMVEPSGYTHQVLYFFAGLAPREVVGIIQNAVRRSLTGAQAQQSPGKIIPLQNVRGITQAVADRLLEEGITDGYLLAMANPIRLFYKTPYDLPQILAWMDECLLLATLPDYADGLRKAGITGAIALVGLWHGKCAAIPPAVETLAQKIGLDKGLLAEVIIQLAKNGQENRIWALQRASILVPNAGNVVPQTEKPHPDAPHDQAAPGGN